MPERLETVLKEEAKRRRLTVSHLIRNVLEDALNLVDTVVTGAGDIVDTSVEIAEQVVRDARRISATARGAERSRSPKNLEHLLAWNPVVVNRPCECASCGATLARGTAAHLGISADRTAPPTWLCGACLAKLPAE